MTAGRTGAGGTDGREGRPGPVDPRTARTRARLRAALIAECGQRPLGEVSLAAVARRAGVGRATLYLHYDGLQALAVDACAGIVRDGVDALHAWRGTPSPDAPPEQLTAFLVAIHRSAGLYRALLPDGGGGPLGALLHRELRTRSHAERVREGAPRPELAAAAVAAAFTGLLADWLHGHVPLPPEEFAHEVWRLLLAVHRAMS